MSCVLCLASKHIPWSAETRYIFVKSIDIDEENIAFDILRSPKVSTSIERMREIVIHSISCANIFSFAMPH